MKIMGPASATLETVRARVAFAHRRFQDEMLPNLWRVAESYGLDPVVMVAQSGVETGWGQFGRLVPPEYHNTCGLKVRDLRPYVEAFGTSEHTFAHAQFASWAAGAHAHAQHLLAYCQAPLPSWAIPLDPREVWVRGKKAPVVEVRELDAWAGVQGYGLKVETACRALALP